MSQEKVTNIKKIKNLSQLIRPSQGWIKYWRQRLEITTSELGERCGYDQPRISRLEKAEINGDLKLSSLKRIADGLDMRFVYGFLPNEKNKVKKQSLVKKKSLD